MHMGIEAAGGSGSTSRPTFWADRRFLAENDITIKEKRARKHTGVGRKRSTACTMFNLHSLDGGREQAREALVSNKLLTSPSNKVVNLFLKVQANVHSVKFIIEP